MSDQTTTHATLLGKLSAGNDPAAWQAFCDRYGALIRGFARSRGLQDADCDDVVQDTLLALTKSMPGFEYDPSRGRFRSYLKTVVLHVIFQRSRQKRAQTALENLDGFARSVEFDAESEDQWEVEWRQHHLRTAMGTIAAEFNDNDRRAFDAYAVGGQDAGETAAGLGLSVEQVYQAKSRILRRLSQLIEQQVREEG